MESLTVGWNIEGSFDLRFKLDPFQNCPQRSKLLCETAAKTTATSTHSEMFSYLSEPREQRGMYGNAVISDVRVKKIKKRARQPLLGRRREFLTKAAGLLKVGGLKSRRSILETSRLNGFQPGSIRTDQWLYSEGKQAAETGKQLNTQHTGGFSVLRTGFGRTWLGCSSPWGMNPGMLLAPEGIVTSDCNHCGSVVMKEHAWLLLHVTEFSDSRVGVYFQNVFGGQFDSLVYFLETLQQSWQISESGSVCHWLTILKSCGIPQGQIILKLLILDFNNIQVKKRCLQVILLNSLE